MTDETIIHREVGVDTTGAPEILMELQAVLTRHGCALIGAPDGSMALCKVIGVDAQGRLACMSIAGLYEIRPGTDGIKFKRVGFKPETGGRA